MLNRLRSAAVLPLFSFLFIYLYSIRYEPTRSRSPSKPPPRLVRVSFLSVPDRGRVARGTLRKCFVLMSSRIYLSLSLQSTMMVDAPWEPRSELCFDNCIAKSS
ncbi:hypothetical protein GW17_00012698 [Ensete ventricosum]|nr:hypothetical protein GW17_00012698 [Ensete ventricosum]